MKRIFILAFIVLINAGNYFSQTTFTWTGSGTTDNFSDLGNWAPTTTVTPGSSDDVIFNGTSTRSCNLNVDINVNNFSINSGYTGTINALSSLPTVNGSFSQADGTFISTNDVTTGFVIGNDMSLTGGTFTHNNGLVDFFVDAANGTTSISGTLVFSQLNITANGTSSSDRNVAFGTSTCSVLNLNGLNRLFNYQGNISILSDLNITGTSTGNPSTNTAVFTFSGAGPISISGLTGSNASSRHKLSSFVFNTSGNITLTGHINLTGNWTGTQGTLTAGTSTVNMYGSTAALSGTAVAFSNLNIQSTGAVTMPTGEIRIGGNLVKTGTLTLQSTSAIGLDGSGAQAIDLSGATLGAINGYNTGSSRAITLSGTIIVLDSIAAQTNVTLNTGGSLTLRSTSSLKGRVGRTSGSISGNVTVETFIPGGTTGWANLGVSGVTGQTVANWDTYVSSGGANGIPMTCTGCVYSQSIISSWFNSIAAWSEPAQDYDTMIVASSSLVTGKGYWVYIGDGQSTSNDLKLVNTGPVVQSTVTIPLTSTTGTNNAKGMNLVANPYASPIRWTTVLAASGGTSTGLANAIYVWNADINNTAQFVAGVSNPSGSTGITDIIPAGQGFYVETTSATNLVFTESAKTSSNTGSHPLLKTASANDIGQVFHLKLKGVYDWDETAFRVHPDATPGFDVSWDAHKIFQSPGYAGYPGAYSKYTTISSKDPADSDYSIQSIPSLTQSISIPVLVRVSTAGTYTINAIGSENINDCILLKDNLMNVTTDLKGGNYIFTISDTTSTPRFELILCRDPYVDLVSVKELTQSGLISISQDEQGAFVKTAFSENTKATISVYSIIGQKLSEDIKVEGAATTIRLNLDLHNQVVLIRVLTDKESSTKKMVIH